MQREEWEKDDVIDKIDEAIEETIPSFESRRASPLNRPPEPFIPPVEPFHLLKDPVPWRENPFRQMHKSISPKENAI